ncbi:hypothetical protein TEA_011231 [Camellia sinensis var. sinensis]|uniref:Bidirectional sugar transporter SWEET n=1 Tax=Camellia sinensis var. sinensis TaxID=542762 RepID=A0A4V3WLL7_CAMSN|nr:hypothetical protein TEA_011231 [Camellia sinensis var. sinensis]
MGGFSSHNLAFAFGLLGNIISFFVFLSPMPTFYQIFKKKSTEGFQSVPYIVALFSAMLLMYYAFLKKNDSTLIITINSFGCLVEIIYICVYLFYAPKKIKKQVIRTKSVEFMPFSLSLSLTLNAIMWFFYGLLIKDFNIAIPNVLGFIFGIIQMVLYAIYKNPKKVVKDQKFSSDQIPNEVIALEEEKLSELVEQVIDVVKLSSIACQEIGPVMLHLNGHNIARELNIVKPNLEVTVPV